MKLLSIPYKKILIFGATQSLLRTSSYLIGTQTRGQHGDQAFVCTLRKLAPQSNVVTLATKTTMPTLVLAPPWLSLRQDYHLSPTRSVIPPSPSPLMRCKTRQVSTKVIPQVPHTVVQENIGSLPQSWLVVTKIWMLNSTLQMMVR